MLTSFSAESVSYAVKESISIFTLAQGPFRFDLEFCSPFKADLILNSDFLDNTLALSKIGILNGCEISFVAETLTHFAWAYGKFVLLDLANKLAIAGLFSIQMSGLKEKTIAQELGVFSLPFPSTTPYHDFDFS